MSNLNKKVIIEGELDVNIDNIRVLVFCEFWDGTESNIVINLITDDNTYYSTFSDKIDNKEEFSTVLDKNSLQLIEQMLLDIKEEQLLSTE